MPTRLQSALRFQAGYYVLTGAWPLLSRRTFEGVTGRKRDWWLVQMVGLLACTNGIAISIGAKAERVSRETVALSVLSALSFLAIDVVYSLSGRISKVYLGDALTEAVLIALVERAHNDDNRHT
jgi:hypothetical protein